MSVGIATTDASCSWTASSNTNWINVTANKPASGTGSGNVSFSVAANLGPPASTGRRFGTVMVAGQTLSVTQVGTNCSYQLQSPSTTFPADGGMASLGVLTATGCAWTASSGSSWLHVAGNGSFNGLNEVSFSADSNAASAVSRQGSLTVAGISYPVSQAAGSCSVALGSPSFSANSLGAAGRVSYTTSDSTCSPTVQSFASWLVVQNATLAGTSGTVVFTVDPNGYSNGRSSSIGIGNAAFAVTQAANACGYILPPSPDTFGGLGGSGTLSIAATAAACPAPIVSIADPFDNILQLNAETGASPNFSQAFTVNPYVSFIPFIRTAEIDVAGQPLKVKQHSY